MGSDSCSKKDSKKGVILISGSAGRIGSSLVRALGDEYHIVGFELSHALYASANEELVPLDVSSKESVMQAFRHIQDFYGKKIVSLVHLAAYYSFVDTKYKKYKKITVEGTRNLLTALQEFEVDQFIFSSTMLVHKPRPLGEFITEESPMAPSWPYPRSKIETEEVIRKERGDISTVVMRIAGVYDDECHSIPISNQIQRVYERQLASRLFPGNLKNGASFMHMDDLIDALLLAIKNRKTLPKETTILIADPETMSTDQIQRKVSKALHGKEITTYRIPKWFAWLGVVMQGLIPFEHAQFIRPWMIKFSDDNYQIDISQAKKILSWKPKHHLSSDLDDMLVRMKKDPENFYKKNGLKAPKRIRKLWAKKSTKQKKKR